jgi:hypothetical protein
MNRETKVAGMPERFCSNISAAVNYLVLLLLFAITLFCSVFLLFVFVGIVPTVASRSGPAENGDSIFEII